MITVRLLGGLGNQMFQRAYGLSLEDRGYEVVFDRSALVPGTHREYGLHAFNVRTYFEPKFNVRSGTIVESSLRYNPAYLLPQEGSIVIGYWQSEKYFSGLRKKVKEAFRINNREIGAGFYLTRSEILGSLNSVFVHVRRGDYLQHQDFHGIPSVDYYVEGLKRLGALPEQQVFIFSDDPDWCRQSLAPVIGGTVVDTGNRFADLELMSLCRHAVIANSSYSWWAAYLGNENGLVVAPKKWFATDTVDSTDIIPDWWIKI